MNLTDDEIERIAESAAAILQVLANKPVRTSDDRLTVEEVMKRFRITNRDSFWRFVHREKVPCVRLNARNVVFPRAALDHWEQKRATYKIT